ncbi:uncharacterized protein BDR25DRAFT_352811 [Lindgomyces ingoldianus]|uniref:Uncharacterized protein n=1 Tax=Lindgomyces ingoldianus TaxID=673940 RepID=A0ACB6R3I7_9PLEO|nr:uncharacterized protein BDR25DRAFT_352811 [Lindgomyces ingoldianus]KAF2473393.1 hypothetical protein BDR25DRAFT_352811 [Lindgomyces ingoldianus]
MGNCPYWSWLLSHRLLGSSYAWQAGVQGWQTLVNEELSLFIVEKETRGKPLVLGNCRKGRDAIRIIHNPAEYTSLTLSITLRCYLFADALYLVNNDVNNIVEYEKAAQEVLELTAGEPGRASRVSRRHGDNRASQACQITVTSCTTLTATRGVYTINCMQVVHTTLHGVVAAYPPIQQIETCNVERGLALTQMYPKFVKEEELTCWSMQDWYLGGNLAK